jgi:hypothetical protein
MMDLLSPRPLPHSKKSNKRIPLASQNSQKHLAAEKVVLNFFQMGDVVCFHTMEAALDLGVKWWTELSLRVTNQNRKAFPSIS